MLSPHHCQGQICSYVLKLQGDEDADFYIYCGYTKDIEKRMPVSYTHLTLPTICSV